MPTPTPTPLRLDRFLSFSIYAANNAFTKVYKPQLDRLGLTYPQYLAMVVLWEQDDRSVGEIGERLGLDTNTLTPLLKRLEAAGLITRERSKADERQVRIRVTQKGRTLESAAATVPASIAQACGLPEDDLQALQQWLDDLRAALGRSASAIAKPRP